MEANLAEFKLWVGPMNHEQDTRLSIHNVRHQVVGVDAQVPLLDGSQRTYVSFDNAASTPPLRPVLDTVNEFAAWYSSVHRGTGFKSQIATRAYQEAREVVGQFVGADPATHTVIFGKNATEALNKLAHRLPLAPGDVVLTTLMEHHSNDLPWRAVARTEHVAVDREGALDEGHLDHLLRAHAGRVRLVAVAGAANVTGYVNRVHHLAEKVHAAGAEILVDAAQLAPHRAIDMRPADDPGRIDYLVLAGHKMYAPFGSGALVGRRAPFLQGDPDMVGGGTVNIVTTDSVMWTGVPEKEEAGSPNVMGAVAMAKAMLCLQEIGMDALAAHEAELTARLLEGLSELDDVTVYGIRHPARAAEKVGVVPFCVRGVSHYLVAAILSAEGGIGVRNGCFCAHPYLLHLLQVPEGRARRHQEEIRHGSRANLPGMVRVSFGCYNDLSEVEWFLEVLKRIVRREYSGRYVQDAASGEFRAEGFAPDMRSYFSLL